MEDILQTIDDAARSIAGRLMEEPASPTLLKVLNHSDGVWLIPAESDPFCRNKSAI